MTNIVKFLNLGKVTYERSNNIQKLLSKRHNFNDAPVTVDSVLEQKKITNNTLLVMEHDPVYTTGLRDYLTAAEQSKLLSLGAQYYRTDRGGLVTFHGPGQLTAYPILNLRHFKPSVKWYVCRLEETIIQTCKKLGIVAERSPHTGVWVGNSKICALGVHISRGITTHGLALNCCTDLKWFSHIVPCGIEGKDVTSLSNELGSTVTIEDTLPTFLKSFEEVFNIKLTPCGENVDELVATNRL
ncbi:lipoyl(octanoyl) transferase 2 [Arctopsyche grandis]|uniref:lipoyl(octanoyl) transferase 2 n=1 Tax=Arctopsyche grandis TaxID=121162 RepID=UPI00406D64B2